MNAHETMMRFCEVRGASFRYNEPGTGEITFQFADSLFFPDAAISWNEFELRQVEL